MLFWYIGRITVEYATESGVRCGGVYGLAPYTDFKIAEDITRIGLPCTGNQVCKWRRTLARLGYVAWKRTPVGQRTLVIGSEKFPDNSLERLPSWAAEIVDRAIGLRGGHPAETAEEITKKWLSLSQTGGAFSQGGVPFRRNGGNNIRKELESEGEKKSVSSIKVDSREIDNSGRAIGRTDSTDFFYTGQKLQVTIKEHAAYVAKYPGICIEDEYPKIDGKIVQTDSQRARWASPKYIDRWLRNLAASKPQPAPMPQKAAPKYGDGMHYERMTHEELAKFDALPASERGTPNGSRSLAIRPGESELQHLLSWKTYHVMNHDGKVPAWLNDRLAKLDKAATTEAENKPQVKTSPMTHEEEKQIAKRVWAQIVETPKGAAVAAALLGEGPPSTRR